MKVTKGDKEINFEPYEITIRIESQKEEHGIYNTFNHASIVRALEFDRQADMIRSCVNTSRSRNSFGEFDQKLKKLAKEWKQ
jgi:hypothetical protein